MLSDGNAGRSVVSNHGRLVRRRDHRCRIWPGLVAARVLCGAGLDVVLLEADEQPGGRVRTDRVDGMLLDRGFQLLNPSYPQARRTFDLRALRLRQFDAGAVVAHGDTALSVRRSTPLAARGARRAATAARHACARRSRSRAGRSRSGTARPRGSSAATTRAWPTSCAAAACAARSPTACCAPSWPACSVRTNCAPRAGSAELLVRSFVRGTPALPEDGMQALPDQLAAVAPDGCAAHLDPGHRRSTARPSTPRRACSTRAPWSSRPMPAPRPAAAAIPSRRTRALTTFYHLAPDSPASRPMLHLDADRRGPVVNSAVLTDVAPSYATGRCLVSSTVLGADGSSQAERAGAPARGRRSTASTRRPGSTSRPTRSPTRCPKRRRAPRSGGRSRSATASTSPATTATPRRSRARWCPDGASPRPCAPTSAGSCSHPRLLVRDGFGVHVAPAAQQRRRRADHRHRDGGAEHDHQAVVERPRDQVREELPAGQRRRGRPPAAGSARSAPSSVCDRVVAEERGEQAADRRLVRDRVRDRRRARRARSARVSSVAGSVAARPAIISEKKMPIDSDEPAFRNGAAHAGRGAALVGRHAVHDRRRVRRREQPGADRR